MRWFFRQTADGLQVVYAHEFSKAPLYCKHLIWCGGILSDVELMLWKKMDHICSRLTLFGSRKFKCSDKSNCHSDSCISYFDNLLPGGKDFLFNKDVSTSSYSVNKFHIAKLSINQSKWSRFWCLCFAFLWITAWTAFLIAVQTWFQSSQ